MSKRFFGTDGIRGAVGEHPITPDFMLKLGWAAGRVFASEAGGGRSTVIIGKDTRVSGYMFESALEAGLVAAGVDVDCGISVGLVSGVWVGKEVIAATGWGSGVGTSPIGLITLRM